MDPTFEIEKIVSHKLVSIERENKTKYNTIAYRVRYAEDGSEEDKLEEDLPGCARLILLYWRTTGNHLMYRGRGIVNEFSDRNLSYHIIGYASKLNLANLMALQHKFMDLYRTAKSAEKETKKEVDIATLYATKVRVENPHSDDSTISPNKFIGNKNRPGKSFEYACSCARGICNQNCPCLTRDRIRTTGGVARCHSGCGCLCAEPEHANILLERSKEFRWELWTAENTVIRPGQVICELLGDYLSEEDAAMRLEYRFLPMLVKTMLPVDPSDGKPYLDLAHNYSPARFATHSCDPNAYIRYVYKGDSRNPTLELIARKQIGRRDSHGYHYQRITLNYFPDVKKVTTDEEIQALLDKKERMDMIVCECGSKGCKRLLFNQMFDDDDDHAAFHAWNTKRIMNGPGPTIRRRKRRYQ